MRAKQEPVTRNKFKGYECNITFRFHSFSTSNAVLPCECVVIASMDITLSNFVTNKLNLWSLSFYDYYLSPHTDQPLVSFSLPLDSSHCIIITKASHICPFSHVRSSTSFLFSLPFTLLAPLHSLPASYSTPAGPACTKMLISLYNYTKCTLPTCMSCMPAHAHTTPQIPHTHTH